MLTLYAIACHAAGDFPLQSNRMAAEKFDNRWVRAQHCAVYTLTFAPFIVATGWALPQAAVFAVLLFGSHFVVDSRRWYEPVDGFETRPLWFDQAFHIISLAIAVAVAGGVPA